MGLRILVDLDGVLAGWFRGVFDAATDLGIDTSKLDLTRWDLADDEELLKVVRAIHAEPGFYRNLGVIDGGREALEMLVAQGHDVVICSTPDSTNPTCASDKIAWVREHLGEEWVKRIVLTHDKTAVRGDILIDDKPDITGHYSPEWRQVIFDQPYNQRFSGPRVHSWDTRALYFAIWEAVVHG